MKTKKIDAILYLQPSENCVKCARYISGNIHIINQMGISITVKKIPTKPTEKMVKILRDMQIERLPTISISGKNHVGFDAIRTLFENNIQRFKEQLEKYQSGDDEETVSPAGDEGSVPSSRNVQDFWRKQIKTGDDQEDEESENSILDRDIRKFKEKEEKSKIAMPHRGRGQANVPMRGAPFGDDEEQEPPKRSTSRPQSNPHEEIESEEEDEIPTPRKKSQSNSSHPSGRTPPDNLKLDTRDGIGNFRVQGMEAGDERIMGALADKIGYSDGFM